MSYDHPLLAAIYDEDNPSGTDHDFFRLFADEVAALRIVDLGCGTGVLTVTLMKTGRTVTGIDPAAAMLERAAARAGGEDVTWVHGSATHLVPDSADLVLMTGNVAMHLIGEEWDAGLAAIARALVPGGHLVFETRNPDARAWETWNDLGSERQTPVGRLRESLVTDPPDSDGVVVMHCHNEFLDTGEIVDVDQPLQFRSRARVQADLGAAGLRTAEVWADWSRAPFTGGPRQPLMVFHAVRADA